MVVWDCELGFCVVMCVVDFSVVCRTRNGIISPIRDCRSGAGSVRITSRNGSLCGSSSGFEVTSIRSRTTVGDSSLPEKIVLKCCLVKWFSGFYHCKRYVRNIREESSWVELFCILGGLRDILGAGRLCPRKGINIQSMPLFRLLVRRGGLLSLQLCNYLEGQTFYYYKYRKRNLKQIQDGQRYIKVQK